MSTRYLLEEPYPELEIPAELGFSNEGSLVHQSLRILTGSAVVNDVWAGKIYKLGDSELRLPPIRKHETARIIGSILSSEVSEDDYMRFVLSVSRQNHAFFVKLRNELILCLIAKKDRRFTESFLYLYRIIEYISTAFPILWASMQSDFSNGYVFLRSLIENERDGELKILVQSIPHLARRGNLSDLMFSFRCFNVHNEYVSILRNELRNCISVKGVDWEHDDDVIFEANFCQIPSLLVSVRNRTFHYQTSKNNVDLARIGGAEKLMEFLLPEFTYWFSLVYVEIVRTLASQRI